MDANERKPSRVEVRVGTAAVPGHQEETVPISQRTLEHGVHSRVFAFTGGSQLHGHGLAVNAEVSVQTHRSAQHIGKALSSGFAVASSPFVGASNERTGASSGSSTRSNDEGC